jgi:hypothetical protein
MILGLTLSFLLALLMGMAIVTLLWPRRRLQANLLTKLSLATGLGLGATSCLSFLYLVASDGRLDGLPVAEILVLLALLGWAIFRHPREKSALLDRDEKVTWTVAAPTAALAVFLMGVATFALSSACWPHGDWDAWSMWNLHARFLYRGGEHWTSLFTTQLDWSPPDYPLMLPASVMRSWVFAGGETVGGPILIAFVFMAGVVLTLFSGLAVLSGTGRASLAAIILVATPFFVGHSAAQYADVPLSFFYLATLVLLCLSEREETPSGILALAGLTCGMAAWTKNEGLLFMVCVLLARTWTLARTSGIRKEWRRISPFIAGLLPPALIVLFFKLQYAPPNQIVGTAALASVLDRALTPIRYVAIVEWFSKHVVMFGKWDTFELIPVSPVPLLLGASALFGIRPDAKAPHGTATTARTLGLTLAGYLLVFLITPHKLLWQMGTAGDRLLLQLWPSALFLFFMVIRDPLSDRPAPSPRDQPQRGARGTA